MCPARVVLYGLGPIGKAVGRLALSRANLEVVGGIDTDPRMAGLDLGECLGADETLGTVVSADADAFLADAQPDVVLHCTQSSLALVIPQLEMIVRHGASVVSTCEELAFPWHAENPELAALDQSARRRGVALLGTGINPGYAMDTVPLMLSAASQRVDHVMVERVQDAGLRRLPLMMKVGVGITVEEFEARRVTIGHIGLPESMYLVADGLGWELDRTERSLEPVISEAAAVFGELTVVPGAVLGVHETVRGFVADAERIVLDLRMYAGAPDPHDAVEIRGVPDLRLRIDGLHGDLGTAAVAVNAVAAVMRARPGVLTMRDMPLVSAFAGDVETRLVAREGRASD
jgi:2,4-diaminopentanoate dehydrogenase